MPLPAFFAGSTYSMPLSLAASRKAGSGDSTLNFPLYNLPKHKNTIKKMRNNDSLFQSRYSAN
ncbi:hypothetical protein QE357_002645 [Siphonobacter sp. BAB-5404]|nr:hypothetical protein [Siphonobacter sp. SORGH_AS_0500]